MIGKKTIVSLTIVIGAIFLRNFKTSNKLKAPVVQISNGKLQGVISLSRDGKEFYDYLGIPYAKKPTGNLRFEPPEPLEESWTGIRDASEYGPKCSQVDLFFNNIEGSEDCLHLSVHTPKIDPDKVFASTKLSTMVFFHGGLFIFGSANLYRADYFLDEMVIIVMVNYRLGSLGFLNTGDGLVRGNMGLKDQVMALKWVQKNIKYFGGNPQMVTIFGESAGGASANFHQLSQMSKGYFHRIIAQSGLSTNPWSLNKTPKEQAIRYAEKLNCTTANSKSMVNCLKNLPLREIMELHLETTDPLRELISVFVPTIEENIPDGKTFLSEMPQKIIESGRYSRVPLLMGLNANEGLINSAVIFRNESLFHFVIKNWEKIIPRLLYLNDSIDPEVLRKIKEFYFNGELNPEPKLIGDIANMTNLFSDRFWNMGFHNGVKAQLNHSNQVYLYYYSHSGEFTLTDILVALKGESHPMIEVLTHLFKNWFKKVFLREEIPRFGVCHSDEIAMQFFVPIPIFPHVRQGHIDYEFSKEIIKLWTTFASKQLNNTSDTDLEFMGHQWPPQQFGQPLTYMNLHWKKSGMISEPFKYRVDFLNSLNLVD